MVKLLLRRLQHEVSRIPWPKPVLTYLPKTVSAFWCIELFKMRPNLLLSWQMEASLVHAENKHSAHIAELFVTERTTPAIQCEQ